MRKEGRERMERMGTCETERNYRRTRKERDRTFLQVRRDNIRCQSNRRISRGTYRWPEKRKPSGDQLRRRVELALHNARTRFSWVMDPPSVRPEPSRKQNATGRAAI